MPVVLLIGKSPSTLCFLMPYLTLVNRGNRSIYTFDGLPGCYWARDEVCYYNEKKSGMACDTYSVILDPVRFLRGCALGRCVDYF